MKKCPAGNKHHWVVEKDKLNPLSGTYQCKKCGDRIMIYTPKPLKVLGSCNLF